MKFRCERDALIEAFGAAVRAVGARSAMPVLTGVRVQLSGDQLSLVGTDLDLTIAVELSVAGQRDGAAVLPARLTADIFRAMEAGTVTVDVGGEQAQVSAGRSVFSIRTLGVDDFPRLPDPPSGAVRIGAASLAEALKQVIPSASHDDARPILTGVLLSAEAGGLRLVATDSYRLAVRDLPGTSLLADGQSVLVPGRALSELARLVSGADEITLHLGDREAAFDVGTVRLTTRLIEGQYPPYRNLIPTALPNKVTVARTPLLDALRRVRLLAKDATPVRLKLSTDGIELQAITQDVGQATEDIEATVEGSELLVAFNPDFLVAGIESLGSESITLETIDALKPAVLRPVDRNDYLYLLMPVRVS